MLNPLKLAEDKDISPEKVQLSRLREHIDNFSGTFLITDKQSKVLYASRGVQESTGYAPAEVVGKKPGQLWGGQMDKSFYTRLWQRIALDQLPFTDKVKNTKKDHTVSYEELHIAPILDSRGEIKFFIELQPDKKCQAGRSFSQEFQQNFAHQHDRPWQTIEFFLKAFSLAEQTWKDLSPSEHLKSDPRQQLISFFESALIEPTQESYSQRSADRELVVNAQKNPAAFNELYLKYYPQVRHYFLYRTGHNEELSQDLTQETFIQAFKHLPQFVVSNASYLTYLMRISHNLLVDYYREKKSITLEENELDQIAGSSLVDYTALFDLSLVWEAVKNLSGVEQKILTLRYTQDLSIPEIAQIVGKSENAIKLHLHRAREKIKQRLY